jgi:hypothetical protein
MKFNIDIYIDEIFNHNLGVTGKDQHVISNLYYKIFRTSPVVYNEMYSKEKPRGWRQFNKRKIIVPTKDNWDQSYENLFSAIENKARDSLTYLIGMANVLTGTKNEISIKQKANRSDYQKIKIDMALYIASLWYRQEHIKGNRVDYVSLVDFKDIIKSIAIELEKMNNWTVVHTTFVQLPFSDNPVITYDLKISEMTDEAKDRLGILDENDKKYWSSLLSSPVVYIPLNKYNLLVISNQSLIEVFKNENKMLDIVIESKKYLIPLGTDGITSLTKENFPVQILRQNSNFYHPEKRWVKAITPIFIFNEYIDLVNKKSSYMATPQEKKPDKNISFRTALNAKSNHINNSTIQPLRLNDYQKLVKMLNLTHNSTHLTKLSEEALLIIRPYYIEKY